MTYTPAVPGSKIKSAWAIDQELQAEDTWRGYMDRIPVYIAGTAIKLAIRSTGCPRQQRHEAFFSLPSSFHRVLLDDWEQNAETSFKPGNQTKTFPPSHFAICEPKISSPFPAQSTSDPATQSSNANRARALQKKRKSPRNKIMSSSLPSNQMLGRTRFCLYAHIPGRGIRGCGCEAASSAFCSLWGLAYYSVQSPLHAFRDKLASRTSSLLIIIATDNSGRKAE